MPILRSPLLVAAGFDHAFPERGASDSDLIAALGGSAIAQVRQVHGACALEATDAAGAEADALIARSATGHDARGPAVGVRVADCVPLLLADQETGAVAAVHAGWRGIVAGVVRAGVSRLLREPAEPATTDGTRRAAAIVAAIGPCIGVCCFEVGADVAEAIERAAGLARVSARREGEKPHVDLRAAVRAQLAALGIPAVRVDDVAGCTKHEPARFHSFRRDGANSGRMLAAIAARRYG
jgi:YfiH family protein